MRVIVFYGAVLCGFIHWSNSALAQNWIEVSNQPPAYSVACSANGSTVAVSGDTAGVKVSTNFGATWRTNLNTQSWGSVACSADGTRLMTTGYNGDYPVFVSTNSGQTWSTNVSPIPFPILMFSADGTKIVLAGDKQAAVSTNFGVSWTTDADAFGINVSALATSANGAVLMAVAGDINGYGGSYSLGSAIFVSTNYGFNWTQINSPAALWKAVACSADGTRWVAAAESFDSGNLDIAGGIWISTNLGGTWTPANAPTNVTWYSVAGSADGTKWVATDGGQIYTSTDMGMDWATNDASAGNWQSIASSADGDTLYAANDQLWTAQTTPTPQLNASASGSNLLLGWIVPSMNFILQQNSNLATTNWVTLTNAVLLNYTNLQYQVILSPTNSQMYFRLAAP